MTGNNVFEFDRTRVIPLWQEGLSRHQIANRLSIIRRTVSRMIRRYEEIGGVQSRPRSGRPRVTTIREDRYIAQSTRRNTALKYKLIYQKKNRRQALNLSAVAKVIRRTVAINLNENMSVDDC